MPRLKLRGKGIHIAPYRAFLPVDNSENADETGAIIRDNVITLLLALRHVELEHRIHPAMKPALHAHANMDTGRLTAPLVERAG